MIYVPTIITLSDIYMSSTLQVSATFAASLVTSPAIGAYLGRTYSDNLVIALASAIALLDMFFILVAVPESLPEKVRPVSWGSQISWDKADPFGVSYINNFNNSPPPLSPLNGIALSISGFELVYSMITQSKPCSPLILEQVFLSMNKYLAIHKIVP